VRGASPHLGPWGRVWEGGPRVKVLTWGLVRGGGVEWRVQGLVWAWAAYFLVRACAGVHTGAGGGGGGVWEGGRAARARKNPHLGLGVEEGAGGGEKKGEEKSKKKLQHLDFARGHPPHYYPGQNVLNFADRTGCGALTIVWP